nr:type VI secretion system-associated FHA domain protein TagH [Enterovibrio coralii]
MPRPQQVTLTVTNTQQLEAGLSASHVFTAEGGTIGSTSQDDWTLLDRDGRVFPRHAEIIDIDNALCLLDVQGATYINGATMPIGAAKFARLKDNDTVLIGPYQIRIHLSDLGVDAVANHGLDNVFHQTHDAALIGSDRNEAVDDGADDAVIDDPLAALDAARTLTSSNEHPLNETRSLSPEQAQESYLLAKDTQWHGEEKTVHADSEYEMSSAITLKRTLQSEDTQMDDKILERLEQEVGRDYANAEKADGSYDPSINHGASNGYGAQDANGYALEYGADNGLGEANHMVAGPLFRGLGVKTGNTENMSEMQAMSEEMGASLQAAVKGLLALHQQVEESRFGMMNKNLQPIEDNPLRLGLPYEETVETLFDRHRSAVHLSAPSAIGESLTNVRHHNEAVQSATVEALGQILRAFSPEVLMRRFSAYRRPGEVSPESADAWAWKMYQSYYTELTSDRQRGFEKLFWEIFDQAYDRKLREKQLEV